MWQNAHDAYLENRVLSADPLELVHMLYQAATRAVQDARRHLAGGDIAARSRSITKAHSILTELINSLDHERGGEISRRLAQLYDYMQRKLLESNFRQTDEPLREVLALLATLTEAWEGLKGQSSLETEPAAIPANPNPWGQPPPQELEPAYTSVSCSF